MAAENPRSRDFRQVVTVEIIVLAAPEVEGTPAAGGLSFGVDVEALVRGAVHEAEAGTGVWVVAGESTVGEIEELTPDGR